MDDEEALLAVVREAVREELANHTITGVEQLVSCGELPDGASITPAGPVLFS
jgi:hypothetical protein